MIFAVFITVTDYRQGYKDNSIYHRVFLGHMELNTIYMEKKDI